MNTTRHLSNCLLGGMLGDTIGLPAEGMHARRIAKLWNGNFKQRLVLGNGMVSDDTEHAVMTLLALQKSGTDPDVFTKRLGGRLRWWFAALPAGLGLATARSCIRLWLGFSPQKSGVFSAGNGPLMRAPVIAAFFHGQPDLRDAFITASTRITHTDPLADESARLIGTAVGLAIEEVNDCGTVIKRLQSQITSEILGARFTEMERSLKDGESTSCFADSFGRKKGMVSGFAPDTAAVAIHAWLRHRGDFRKTIEAVVAAGGDTDTVAFVAGSIAGAGSSSDSLPADWLDHICDFPINPPFVRRAVEGRESRMAIWPLAFLRNMIFLIIVLFHGFRRLFPPYR